jgi:hypothetical protein
MMTYRRTGLSLCVAACLALIGCDGDGKSASDTGTDTRGTQAQQPQQKQKKQAPDQQKKAVEKKGPDRRASATSKKGVVEQEAPLHVQEIFVPDAMAKLFEVEPRDQTRIPGIEPSPDYNSQRLAFDGHEGFGLGVQVWAFEEPEKAESRFEDFRQQYLNVGEAEAVPDIAEGAFASERGSLKTIVVLFAEPKPRIMAVTCDTGLCSESDHFEELMVMAGNRIRTTYRD